MPKTLENQAGKINGVQELQKQSGIIDETKSKLDLVKDPSSGKEKAVEMVREISLGLCLEILRK